MKKLKVFACQIFACVFMLCLSVTLAACGHKHDFSNGLVCDCGKVSDAAAVEVLQGDEKTYFETLNNEVLATIEKDATIKLLKDIEISSSVSVDVNLVINFGGHKLTSSVGGFDLALKTKGATLKLSNGTLETGHWGVWVQNGGILTVDADFTIEANKSNLTTANAITIEQENSTAEILGTVKVGGTTSVVSGNGSEGKGGYKIHIASGAVLEGGEIGVYMPNSGELQIDAATITADTALYIKSGTTIINGATLKGVGVKKDYEYRKNGATATGDAVVIDSIGYVGGDPSVTINSATITSTTGHEIMVYLINGHQVELDNKTAYQEVVQPLTK